MEEECDRAYPQEVALSQTCWEYKALLHQQSQTTRQHEDVPARKVDSAGVQSSKISSTIDHHHHHHHGQDPEGDARRPPGRPPKRHKASPPVSMQRKSQSPRAKAGRSASAITSLQTLRLSGNAQLEEHMLKDVFVLVLQSSGLQQITSRAGFDVDFGTLLVADPSSAFLRVTLWRNAARAGARLIRAGDLVRLNRVGVSTFRGAVQAHSTASTRFRVVWRGDTFTTRDDAKATTMLSLSQTFNSRGRGGGTRFRSDPLLSQDDDDLAVPREDACYLAAWAKSEFPSVVSTDYSSRHETAAEAGAIVGAGARARAGAGAGAAMVRPLGAVQKGVVTTVHACVLNVSDVERLWVWDSVAGKRQKDLLSRANALITDGMHREMTLQLWGALASDEAIGRLRAGAVASQAVHASPSARGRPIQNPVVFEFTELQPEFSFSCEALVLNGKGGKIRALPPGSPEAMRVSEAVVAAAAASLETGQSRGRASSFGSPKNVDSSGTSSQAEADLPTGGMAALPRRFQSVAALLSADGFSGACRLSRVVVRKVDAPHLSSPGVRPPFSSKHGRVAGTAGGSGHPRGVGHVTIFVGDDEESESVSGVERAGGVEAVVPVSVDGGALEDLLGCNPDELLALAPDVAVDVAVGGDVEVEVDGDVEVYTGVEVGVGDKVGVAVEVGGSRDAGGVGVGMAGVLWSLLFGLEVGGERGERVDVVLACSASVDANGWVTPGGSCYRLVSLQPSRESSAS